MKIKVRLEEDKGRLYIKQNANILALWNKAKRNNGGYVEIENIKKLRSTGMYSQNHHFNGHCLQIAKETGNDFAYIKYWVKKQAINMGYPYSLNKFGEPVPQSESEATSEQCAILIEQCHILSSELNILLEEGINAE